MASVPQVVDGAARSRRILGWQIDKHKLIALCANGRQAGKDTAANFIQEWCELREASFQSLAFADAGKSLVGAALHIPPYQVDRLKLEGELEIETGGARRLMSGRQFIINLLEGTKEVLGEEIWALQTLPMKWKPGTDFIAITDLRFPVEVDRVRDCMGLIVHVHRPGAEEGASENELTGHDIDWILLNTGDEEALRQAVFEMMDSLTYRESINATATRRRT